MKENELKNAKLWDRNYSNLKQRYGTKKLYWEIFVGHTAKKIIVTSKN